MGIPPVDFSKVDTSNPEAMLSASKKGKTIMLFAKINKFKDKHETEEISSIWHTGLYNAHIHGERFLVEDSRVMFSFKDGSYAWEAKDFLIEQERVEDVQLEGKTYKEDMQRTVSLMLTDTRRRKQKRKLRRKRRRKR